MLHGELPLKAHAHQANDIFTALRIAQEFNVKITLEHVTEGHLIVDELKDEPVPMAVGPSLTHASKFELRNKRLKPGYSGERRLPGFDHYRFAGNSAAVSAAVCRTGDQIRHEGVGCVKGDYD